ncbi:MAG: hypothetical protein WBY88_05295, partial [Desulfosarcina sp.]
VHDSFVIPVKYADECRTAMLAAFEDQFGQPIPIDGSYEQGVMNAMNRDHVLGRSPEWDRLERDVTIAINTDDEISVDCRIPDSVN